MDRSTLLEALEYTRYPQKYLRLEEATPGSSLALLYNQLRESSCSGLIDGVYCIETSPSEDHILPQKPVVFVVQAMIIEEAQKIRHALWNTGKAPFILLVLPHEVRIYSGFYFDDKDSDVGLIDPVPTSTLVPDNLQEIREQFAAFSASAIDTGRIWENYGASLHCEQRVDVRLLRNLQEADHLLEKECGLSIHIRHNLLGKYIYLRYLRDRGILSQEWMLSRRIDPKRVFGEEATKDDLKKMIAALDAQFNGQVFPLDFEGQHAPSDDAIKLVARMFRGDDLKTGQMACDFGVYDFRFIPIELLASIYEQFLDHQRDTGAYYPPVPLAEYLFYELHSCKPLLPHYTILDPSCGSGTFLVLVFQQMVAMEQERQPNTPLSPEALSALLRRIYGVEREEDACYITEFSLLLTLLSYIDPPELHTNERFRFPVLHNRQIFHCDFFDATSVFVQQKVKFDWIIGNPPWIEIEKNREPLIQAWTRNNAKERPVGKRSSDAFSWKVMDFLTDNGMVALLLHAKMLFNKNAVAYRQSFFQAHDVKRITNFANLRYILFPKAKAPTITCIYTRNSDNSEQNARSRYILHYGPFLVNQSILSSTGKDGLWTISINGSEVKTLSSYEAIQGDSITWKVALWGTYRDKRLLERLEHAFPRTLGQIIKEHAPSWTISEGPSIRDHTSTEDTIYHPELAYKPILSMRHLNASRNKYSIPANATSLLLPEQAYLRKKGGDQGLQVFPPPHIIMNAAWNSIIFHDEYLIIPNRQWGISAPREDAAWLRALSLYLSSSFVRYSLFFRTPDYGIERDRGMLDDVKMIPVPDFTVDQITSLANMQERLAATEIAHELNDYRAIQEEIDRTMCQMFQIPTRFMVQVQEFLEVWYPLRDGRTQDIPAVQSATKEHLYGYSKQLTDYLNEFAQGNQISHRISMATMDRTTVCQVEFLRANEYFEPVLYNEVETSQAAFWSEARKMIREQTGQWISIQRDLRIYQGTRIFLCKSSRRIDWTITQAYIDADSIIDDMLASKKERSERDIGDIVGNRSDH